MTPIERAVAAHLYHEHGFTLEDSYEIAKRPPA